MIQIQKAGKNTEENFLKRILNIKFFASLKRDNLCFKTNNTKSLEIYRTTNEIVKIIYPGKESASSTPKPWDFRPILTKKNIEMKNLSFGDIWESLYQEIFDYKRLTENEIKNLISILYKMAFYNTHKLINDSKIFEETTLDVSEKIFYTFDKTLLTKEEQYILMKDITVKDNKENTMTISMESFLIYNDLLCANEDCKYFYLKNIKEGKEPKNIFKYSTYKEFKNCSWEATTGRINTFLTHINFLAWTLNKQKLSSLLDDISRKRGVSPIDNKTLLSIFK